MGAVIALQAAGLASPPSAPAVVVTQIPVDRGVMPAPAAPSALRPLPAGSRVAVSRPQAEGRAVAVLSSGFDAAGRPCVSFDGERVLFVGRKDPGSPDSVWEMNLDGTGLREVVAPRGGADRAIYLPTLYTMQSGRPTARIAFRASGYAGRPQLFTCAPDGTDVQPITFAPGGVMDPIILSDSRLLFGMHAGEASATSSARDVTAWFTVHIDGTDLFPFAAVHEPSRRHGSPVEWLDDRVLYLEGEPDRADGFDTIVSVARTDSLTTRREIARFASGGLYGLAAAPDGAVLVTARLRPTASMGIYLMHDGAVSPEPVLDDPAWHEVNVAPVAVRGQPPGRSSVVVPTRSTGKLYCLDVYLSNTDAGQHVERGQVRRVRFMTPAEAPVTRDAADEPEGRPDSRSDVVLGYQDVERDGSFAVELPARTPFRMESLDAAGQVVQSMRSWMWVMPTERRGCIGCHEDRALTPPNRHVTALRKRLRRIGVKADVNSEEAEE